MKINTTTFLRDLTGEFIPMKAKEDKNYSDSDYYTTGKAIAMILTSRGKKDSKFDAFKAYELAKRFYNDPEIEIDAADFEIVKEEIKTYTQFTNLIIGQLLGLLQNVKDE